MLKTRIFAIACGYPDGNDLDWLRFDPAFKLACGRLPDTGNDLCSQPTISRWENAPTLREIIRLTYALTDIWCRSYAKPPASVILDIKPALVLDPMDTLDVAHGHQKMAEWNAHYDERCFLPIHIYDTATGRPVTMILRPGKTPSGKQVRRWLRRLIKRIRQPAAGGRLLFVENSRCQVRQYTPASAENRRPRHRNGEPHPRCAHLVLPGGWAVQPRCVPAPTVRAMNGGT